MTVWDERTNLKSLLANQLQFAAKTIADIYRELMFQRLTIGE